MSPERTDGAGPWAGLVVIASGSPWDGPAMSERMLAQALAAHAPVLFVDPPASLLSVLRDPVQLRRFLRRRLAPPAPGEPGVVRLATFGPPGLTRPVLRGVNRRVLRRAIGRAVRRLGGEAHALVIASLEDLAGAARERVTVLYGTDDFRAGSALMGMAASWLQRAEPQQVTRADVVVAVSEPLACRWRRMGARDVRVVPNGCNAELYARTDEHDDPADVDLPRPIAGFVGHLSDRIDVRCLEAVADTGHSLLLVGPRQRTFAIERMGRLLARPNVQWVGAKPSEQLPSYLKVMDVGLTPYADTAFNRASHPLKTLEYLAAGRPAVSTDLPSARALPRELVAIAQSPAEFGQVAARLLRRGPGVPVASMRAFAATQSWTTRAAQFADAIGAGGPRPPVPGSARPLPDSSRTVPSPIAF